MTLKIEFMVLLTPAAQEEIEDRLRDFLEGLGIAARIYNTETGNTTMTREAGGGS